MPLPTEAALLELERFVFLNAATRILVSAPQHRGVVVLRRKNNPEGNILRSHHGGEG